MILPTVDVPPGIVVITREFGFDMGHMLPDHDGACHRPHGHRYTLHLTVAGALTEYGSSAGMVADFGMLKGLTENVIRTYDHRFAVAGFDTRLRGMRAVFDSDDLVILNVPPTAEHLAAILGQQITEWMPDGVAVVEVVLYETPTCSARWRPEGGDAINGPHSRACGMGPHAHGSDCHPNCPTCGGQA